MHGQSLIDSGTPSAAFWVTVSVASLVFLVIVIMLIVWCCCPSQILYHEDEEKLLPIRITDARGNISLASDGNTHSGRFSVRGKKGE